jgi:hypothetical protein
MSVVSTVRATLRCDRLGCGRYYEGSPGCGYTAEVRTEAVAEGWRVNVPRGDGPRNVAPLPVRRARLDFCADHREVSASDRF